MEREANLNKFLIAGTGHCGTGYIAELLNKIGIDTGHEFIFNPDNPDILENGLVKWKDKVGEVSWESCFYLERIPRNIMIYHQVRDPIKVIRAFMREKFFENKNKWFLFAEKHLNFSSLEKHDKYLFWYYTLNKLIERHVEFNRYKVEMIDSNLVSTILHNAGFKNLVSIQSVINDLPKNINSHAKKEDELITWDTFPNSELKEKVMEMAVEYGYVIT